MEVLGAQVLGAELKGVMVVVRIAVMVSGLQLNIQLTKAG